MSPLTPPLRLAALLLAALGAACTTVPPTSAVDAAPAHDAMRPLTGGAAVFEQRWRERALAQSREGRLGEAAQSWEILAALRPESGEYRARWLAARREIDAAVPERMQRAQQAWKRGDLDAATTQFLSVLAMQPDEPHAADALRAIERERNRSLYLGKLSRITLTRGTGSGTLRGAKPAPAQADRNDVEHAALLRTQGETDAAIALLEKYVAARGADPEACRMLSEMLLQKSGAGRLKHAAAGAKPTASSPCP
jgi:predicted Zn-dependent protease